MTREDEFEQSERRDISGRGDKVENLQRPTLPSLPTEKSHQSEIMIATPDDLSGPSAGETRNWGSMLKGALVFAGVVVGLGLYLTNRKSKTNRPRRALH